MDDEYIQSNSLFPWVGESKSGKHQFEVRGEKFKGGLRGKIFQRVVIIWNELPEKVAEANTITEFKRL